MERDRSKTSAYRATKKFPVWYWAVIAAFISIFWLGVSKRNDSGDTEQGSEPAAGRAKNIGAGKYGLSENEALLTDMELAAMVAAASRDPSATQRPDVSVDAPRPGTIIAPPPLPRPNVDSLKGKSLLEQLWEGPQGRMTLRPVRLWPHAKADARASDALAQDRMRAPVAVEPKSVQPQAVTASAPGYWLQAGAFRTMALAEASRARIGRLGLTTWVEPTHIGGSPLYRVRLGPYAAPSELDSVRRQLAHAGIEAAAIHSVATAAGSTEVSSTHRLTSLGEGGKQPWRSGQPGYQLLAGAFGSVVKAEQYRSRIGHLGLESRVEPAGADGQSLYRVYLGPFGDRDQVENIKRRLTDGGIASHVVGLPAAFAQPQLRAQQARSQQAIPADAATAQAQKPMTPVDDSPGRPRTGTGWSVETERLVQTGAFTTVEQAEAHRARIALMGLPARVESANVGGQALHRVRLRPYRSGAEIDGIRRRPASSGVASTVLARTASMPMAAENTK